MTVGLIGVGTMGRIVAAALRRAGHPVLAYDPDPEAQRQAREAGARVVTTTGDLGIGAEVVLLSVPRPQDVRMVVVELLARPVQGLIIVDTSTVDPATTREMAAAAQRRGVGYLDAPILGRPASAGQWTVVVGGEAAVLERARPVLETFAARVVHIGPSGSGHTLKLLNQMMFATINAVTAEVLAIAAKLGLPPALFVDVIATSGAATASGLFREIGTKIARRDFAPVFPVDLLCKDTELALEMAREGGAPAVVTGLVQTLNQLARSRGAGSLDTAALVQVYEALLATA